jgi:hypothetical protein
MTRRSVAAWIVGLGLLVSVPGQAEAQTTAPDLSTLMRSQILDIWLSRTGPAHHRSALGDLAR